MKPTICALGLAALLGCATGSSSVKTQDYLVRSDSGESLSEKYERFDQLDPGSDYDGRVSVRGYAMRESTELELRLILGIHAGTVKVITDGEGNFFSEGQNYHSEAYFSTTDIVLKEMDTNGDKIITSSEADSVSQKVQEQYAQRVGKDEFKRRLCTSQRRNELNNCEFSQAPAEGRCRFDYVAENGHINFERHMEESNCRFNSFRDHSSAEPCLNTVALKYDQEAREMEATHVACLKQISTDIAKCKYKAEEKYKQCLDMK